MRWHLQLIGAFVLSLLACDSTERRTNEPDKRADAKQDEPAAEPTVEADKADDSADAKTSPAQPALAIATAPAEREQCIRDCVEARKMEARAPEAIEADCGRGCEAAPKEPEPIPCENVDACWVSDTTPAQPIVRPKQLRGRKFEPCRDGEVSPACVEGRCALVAHGC
jgi:hypothetical protein